MPTDSGLPRQQAVIASLTRDTQLRDVLDAGLDAALGRGILSGGEVTKTAALSVEIAAGTVFFAYGVSLTLAAAQAYTISGASPVTLWGRILRTPADPTEETTLDTYALALSHNSTDEAPAGDGWFRVARFTVTAGEITAIETPPDAWVRAAALGNLSHVAAGETAYIPKGYQMLVANEMRVEGELVVRGELIVRAF